MTAPSAIRSVRNILGIMATRAVGALRIDNGQAQQGELKAGSPVTLWLQGHYSVASGTLVHSDYAVAVPANQPL